MARKKSTHNSRKPKSSPPKITHNENQIQNGLGQAIGYSCSSSLVNFGQGYSGGNPWAPQISQMNTIFENLRWYLISNFRQPLSQAYVELGLVQTVVDVPVDDALRGGIDILSKQLDEDQIYELQVSLDREKDLVILGQAAKWNRLFGGAGIIVIVDDQDYELPLDLKSIDKNSDIEFRAADMWELFNESQDTDEYDMETQMPEFEFYNYYGHKLHKSRVMPMKGLVAPSFIRPRLRGWGFSVIEILIRSINQYLKSSDLAFACMDEFKVDIYKIKNLVNTLMMPDGGAAIASRLQMANWQKNYQNALVMDSEDDWDHKQLSFAGLAETMQGIRMQVAADMRMPITKLFGTSASAGLGNTDQNDMENYNSMVESQVRNKIKYDALRMLEIKCQKMFGFIPDDLQIEFKPLRVLSAVEEETVKTSKFARLLQMRQLGEIDSETLLDACNKENLLGIQLDAKADALNPTDSLEGDSASDEADSIQNEDQVHKDPHDDGVNLVQANLPKVEAPIKPKSLDYEADFDFMAYAADGGDDWIRPDQIIHYSLRGDENLWEASMEASKKYMKSDNEKYRIWWYRKKGGAFGENVKNYEDDFDLMAYDADGGNDWIDLNQMRMFEKPLDQSLWSEASDASQKYLKSDNDKYKVWFYRKKGGKFGDPDIKNNSFLNRFFK